MRSSCPWCNWLWFLLESITNYIPNTQFTKITTQLQQQQFSNLWAQNIHLMYTVDLSCAFHCLISHSTFFVNDLCKCMKIKGFVHCTKPLHKYKGILPRARPLPATVVKPGLLLCWPTFQQAQHAVCLTLNPSPVSTWLSQTVNSPDRQTAGLVLRGEKNVNNGCPARSVTVRARCLTGKARKTRLCLHV